jgi:hypothetical protein
MPVARLLMGAFAVYIAWTLVRALRTGIIFSDGIAYDAHQQPRMFASTAAIHGGGAVLFAWLAANGGVTRLLPFTGLH